MKIFKLFFFVLVYIFSINISAQSFRATGNVIDNQNVPLSEVEVVLKNTQNGTFTNLEGNFSLPVNLNDTLVFSFIGMKTQEFIVKDSLATILLVLEQENQDLDEVVITYKKPLVKTDKGKLTFTVKDNSSTVGATVQDLLVKLPGVSLNQEEKILYKGSEGVNVMINGKMTYLSGGQLAMYLKGLQAADVSSIELINNPDASMDASGNSGIINIVTKKANKDGYALSFRSSISKGKFWMNNQNVSGSYTSDKFSAYASFDYNTPHRHRTESSTNHIVEDNKNTLLQRDISVDFKIFYYTWKVGTSWQFAPKHRLGLHYHGYYDDFKGVKDSYLNKISDQGILNSRIHSIYYLEEPYHYDGFNFDYQYDIDDKGKKLVFDARYILYRNFSSALMDAYYFSPQNNLIKNEKLANQQPANISIKTLQLDVDLPTDFANFKVGAKYAFVSNDNNFSGKENKNGSFVWIPEMTNHFKFQEQTSALYATGSKTWGATSLDVGLRLEHIYNRIDLLRTNFKNENSYTKLFPNLTVSHQFENADKWDVSASRRINRPKYSNLNPVRWYQDPYYYFYGNPYLQPEMAWIFNSTYTLANKYIFSVDYSYKNNYISESISYDDNGVTLKNQNVNFKIFNRFDVNFITNFKLASFWQLQFLGGLNYTQYPIEENQKEKKLKRLGGQFSLQQEIKLGNKFLLEVNSKYTSKELVGIYLVDEVFFMDLGLKKTFLNGKLNLAFSVSDVFNGIKTKGVSQTSISDYQFHLKPDSRRFSLSLQYTIGGEFKSQDKKKTEEQQRL